MALLSLLLVLACCAAVAAAFPLPDVPYEQSMSDRYLFSGEEVICSAWPVLPLLSVRTVQALPAWHSMAAEGAWMVANTTDNPQQQTLVWFSSKDGSVTEISAPFPCSSIVLTGFNESSIFPLTAVALCDGGIVKLMYVTGDARVVNFASLPLGMDSPMSGGVYLPLMGNAGTLFFAAENGLNSLALNADNPANVGNITEPLNAIAYSRVHQTMFAGSANHLYIGDLSAGLPGRWRLEWVTSLIDSPVTSLGYDEVNDQLWIGQADSVDLLRPVLMPDGQTHWQFVRLAGFVSDPGSDIGGLPYANTSVIAIPPLEAPAAGGSDPDSTSDGRVWLLGAHGAVRFDSLAEDERDQWRVFNSARFMPSRESIVNVSSATVLPRPPASQRGLDGNSAIVVALQGIAVLRFPLWTLAEKADSVQSVLSRPGHEKYGLVGSCDMSSFGDVNTCQKELNDNDGLWTAIYLASQAWRYAVTKDPAVRAAAWNNFGGMKRQQVATGIFGYPARTVAKRSDFPTSPPWYLSPTLSEWQFKGDTSSDEITGHGFIHPIVAALLASNASEAAEAQNTMLNITDNIVTNDFYLIGELGVHTQWGVWNPSYINVNALWQEGRGPNSEQILSWLAQSYAVSGNASYAAAMDTLMSAQNRYDANLINSKMIAVCDSDFSDDELTYMSTANLQHAYDTVRQGRSAITDPREREAFLSKLSTLIAYSRAGLDRAHAYKVRESSPFYNAIYCYASGQASEEKTGNKRKKVELLSSHYKRAGSSAKSSPKSSLRSSAGRRLSGPSFDCASLSADSVWYMRRWPVELINFPQFNSDRLDVQFNVPAFGCRAGDQILSLLPPDESQILSHWNSGPFESDGGDGMSEQDPGTFLFGYWMMRYYGWLQ
jgi:hypothetical protein